MPQCPGPYIWYPFELPKDDALPSRGAILHCATCGHINVTGNYSDRHHTYTALVHEGLPS